MFSARFSVNRHKIRRNISHLVKNNVPHSIHATFTNIYVRELIFVHNNTIRSEQRRKLLPNLSSVNTLYTRQQYVLVHQCIIKINPIRRTERHYAFWNTTRIGYFHLIRHRQLAFRRRINGIPYFPPHTICRMFSQSIRSHKPPIPISLKKKLVVSLIRLMVFRLSNKMYTVFSKVKGRTRL